MRVTEWEICIFPYTKLKQNSSSWGLTCLKKFLTNAVRTASQTPSKSTRTSPPNSTALTESPRLVALPTHSCSLANPIAGDQNKWLVRVGPERVSMGQTVGGIAVAASTIYSYLCEDTELAHTDVEKKFREASRISAFGSLKNKLISTGKENFKEKKD